MLNVQTNIPKSWLAFELNILKRLKFNSIAFPFTNDPILGIYLKRWNVRVLANDLTQTGWTKAVATIQNNGEFLSDEDVNSVLEDAYVPQYRLRNPALKNWFTETDAWWFDNVRQNIEKLPSSVLRAVASTIALSVGDYVFSFGPDTLAFRQPLSTVFRRLWSTFPKPFNNRQNNVCSNKHAYDFVAETFSADLMFLRLPGVHNQSLKNYFGWTAWREEWLRGGDDFWTDLENVQSLRLGAPVATKSQYLRFLCDFLQTAKHFRTWAIFNADSGFITTQELVESIGQIRCVDTIFTKDFSEFTGTKAVIITA